MLYLANCINTQKKWIDHTKMGIVLTKKKDKARILNFKNKSINVVLKASQLFINRNYLSNYFIKFKKISYNHCTTKKKTWPN